MNITVMVEQIEGNGFRATAMFPSPLIADAPTREEAVAGIDAKIRERLANAELIQLSVPTSSDSNPWLSIAGTWRDHPDFDEVMENIRAYRNEVDADPNRL